eukprot:TRINITY_DN3191_c0_g1_i1.p1 TRINITY_DN3191_c0_g1~~TRINITY_DN3191_c0_g1_i1.p1  ORF type:complete len:143 (-),score=13.04 TRINITY_DN3191_c0_g1_i1:72-500(-)
MGAELKKYSSVYDDGETYSIHIKKNDIFKCEIKGKLGTVTCTGTYQRDEGGYVLKGSCLVITSKEKITTYRTQEGCTHVKVGNGAYILAPDLLVWNATLQDVKNGLQEVALSYRIPNVTIDTKGNPQLNHVPPTSVILYGKP